MGPRNILFLAGIAGIAAGAGTPAFSADRFVAGTAPWQRPADAPVIKEFKSGDVWRKQALAGVSEPVPPSLRFLDNQGAWYTPFNRPGMPGYYDLRGLHGAARSASSK
jgi:hypothetical protein